MRGHWEFRPPQPLAEGSFVVSETDGAFVVDEKNGKSTSVHVVSCPSSGHCSAGGSYQDVKGRPGFGRASAPVG